MLISPEVIASATLRHDSDRYYKRFKIYGHLVAMLHAALSGSSSLRELSTILLAREGRIGRLNLKYNTKRSTLFDANKDRDAEVFVTIYYGLFNTQIL